MNRQIRSGTIVFLAVFVLSGVAPGGFYGDVSSEEGTLKALGLEPGAADAEILGLLDNPKKQILAMGVVSDRKMASAVPKLVQLLEDQDSSVTLKVAAARCLLALGNKDWVGAIKGLLEDSGSSRPLSNSKRIKIARLLAKVGDYSEFEVLRSSIGSERRTTRFMAITTLWYFDDKTDETALQAANLLEEAAMRDADPHLREMAIGGLEKIARARPEVRPKVIRALDANLGSADEGLRATCRRRRESYRRQTMPAEEVIRLLDEPRQFLDTLSLIKQRKLTEAAPRLLEVVRSEEAKWFPKLYAAKTLLALDNRQWMEPMKVMSSDPNIPTRQRLSIVAVLAQAGDYTQFEFVTTGLMSEDSKVREEAAKVLPNFRSRASQVLGLLVPAAKRDEDVHVRMAAIASIESIVAQMPGALLALIEVLEANVDSESVYLRKLYGAKLKQYREAPKQE